MKTKGKKGSGWAWRLVLGGGIAVMAMAWGGCASTPESRIEDNPELFAELGPEEQETVRAGRVRIGYSPEMVYLALGAPDRKVTRRTAEDVREIWIYYGRYVTTETVRLHDYFGRFRPLRPAIYLDRTVEHVYTRARLEFDDGKLVSVEQTEQ